MSLILLTLFLSFSYIFQILLILIIDILFIIIKINFLKIIKIYLSASHGSTN